MNRQLFSSEHYRRLLEHSSLNSFEALWNLDAKLVEESNVRRGGWSEALSHELKLPDGGSLDLIMKRQMNHNTWSLHHPFRGVPTLYREWKNVQLMARMGVPTSEAICYAERSKGKDTRAIFVCKALSGYKPLDEWVISGESRDKKMRKVVFLTVAKSVSKLHMHHYQYSCLYSRHVLVKTGQEKDGVGDKSFMVDCRFIDLEKMRRRFSRFRIAVSDLEQLYRRFEWDPEDWDTFIHLYIEQNGLSELQQKLSKAILERTKKKKSAISRDRLLRGGVSGHSLKPGRTHNPNPMRMTSG